VRGLGAHALLEKAIMGFGPNEDHNEVGQFHLRLRRSGHQWAWSIHNSQDLTSIASGNAPSIAVAESAAEEIAGERLEQKFF
jgi:hypothetical protein